MTGTAHLFWTRLAMVAGLALGLATAAAPQVPQPAAPQAPQVAAPPVLVAPANDRIFGFLPGNVTLEAARSLPPLSGRQKFALASQESFNPVEFGYIGFVAGFNQVRRENPSWGFGMSGYAKRYGEALANQSIENLLVVGALPAMIHQDPRYYQMATGSYLHRIAYAASRIVIARGDAGQEEFNVSEMAGALGAAGLSRFYEPRGSRTIVDTAQAWATDLALDAGTNELREFWPDIKQFIFKR